MGVRGEIFSTRLILPNRTYFLNVKENRLGDFYLNIVESKNKETGGFERQSVIVFADDLPAFLGEFDKALKNMEKIMREQKQGGKKRSTEREEAYEETYKKRDRQDGKERRYGKDRQNGKDNYRQKDDYRPAAKPEGSMRSRFEKPSGADRQTGKSGYGKRKEQAGDRKRVVVKKNSRKKD